MRIFFGVLLMAILYIPFLAFAEEIEYIDYTVKKGDTLWDIANGKLANPFSWPKVWKENPDIKNPDLIFPGQKLKITLSMVKKPEELQVAKEVPPEKKVTVEKKPVEILSKRVSIAKEGLIASGGYIEEKIPEVGKVLLTPDGRKMMSIGDLIYIDLVKDNVKKDSRFYSVKSYGEVKHPVTGNLLGYLIELTGVIEITGKEAGYTLAKVVKTFSEIATKQTLIDYYPIRDFPLIEMQSPDIKGIIVELKELRRMDGIFDIVYIDRGSINGVQPGNIFTIISGRPPHRPIGEIQVITVKEKTSSAIVLKSEMEIIKGDYF